MARIPLADLIGEAGVVAEVRGHRLRDWRTFSGGGCAYTFCARCGRSVRINTAPATGESLFDGAALEASCDRPSAS
jgi:hypothetical protein